MRDLSLNFRDFFERWDSETGGPGGVAGSSAMQQPLSGAASTFFDDQMDKKVRSKWQANMKKKMRKK